MFFIQIIQLCFPFEAFEQNSKQIWSIVYWLLTVSFDVFVVDMDKIFNVLDNSAFLNLIWEKSVKNLNGEVRNE